MGLVAGIALFTGAMALFGWLAGSKKGSGDKDESGEPVSQKREPLPAIQPPTPQPALPAADVKAEVEKAVKAAEDAEREAEKNPEVAKTAQPPVKPAKAKPAKAKPAKPFTETTAPLTTDEKQQILDQTREEMVAKRATEAMAINFAKLAYELNSPDDIAVIETHYPAQAAKAKFDKGAKK